LPHLHNTNCTIKQKNIGGAQNTAWFSIHKSDSGNWCNFCCEWGFVTKMSTAQDQKTVIQMCCKSIQGEKL
jgi:hypothetical protein